MRNRTQTNNTRRHNTRIDNTRLILALVLVSLGFAFVLGLSASGLSPERQQLALEEQKAIMPWRVASKVTGYIFGGIVFKVTVYVLGSFGGYYVLRVGLNWLDLRSRQVHAQDGIFPLVRLNDSTLYDANRAMGEHPLITGMALEVQRTAALKADKIMVKMGDNKALQQANTPALAEAVNLPSLVRLSDVARNPSLDALALGVSEKGTITASLYDLMHVLAVGASGFGKSAFLRALIWQLAQVREPVSIVGVDCFGSELNIIQDWSKLLYPVAKELPEATATLQAVTAEIARRKALYADYPKAFDLPSYNRLASEPLEPIVLFVDEGTAMLNESGIADPLRQVVQTARQFGVYALLAGQNVTHKVMPTQIRDNFSTRLCFHTSTSSRHVVLGETPDDVTVKGRAWVQRPGETLQQMQCPFVTREEVGHVLQVGKPARVLDVEAVNLEVTQDDKEEQILELLSDDTLADSKIASMVYGYNNARTVEKVKELRRRRQNDGF